MMSEMAELIRDESVSGSKWWSDDDADHAGYMIWRIMMKENANKWYWNSLSFENFQIFLWNCSNTFADVDVVYITELRWCDEVSTLLIVFFLNIYYSYNQIQLICWIFQHLFDFDFKKNKNFQNTKYPLAQWKSDSEISGLNLRIFV